MRRLSAVFLFAIRIAAFPVPGEVQTDLDHHFADEIISGRDGDGAQLVGRSKQPVHFNPLAARQFDLGSIFGGRPGGQRPAGQLPSIPGFPFGRGSQGGRGGGRGSRGGRGQQGQQPQPNRPPGLPSNPQPGSAWLPGGVPAGGPGYQSSTDAPPVEPNPTDPAVEDTPPAPVEPLPSSSPSPAPEGPLLPGGVPAGGPGYEAQNSANEPSAAPAPIPSSDDGPVAPIEPRPKPSPAPTSSLEATPASPVTSVAGPGPVGSLENGPPSPSQPNSSPDGVTAPVGDPYLVTLPPLKPSDPLPDSKPKGVLAPQPLNGGASFTNTPGLPAGEPYVVALPDSKPKATPAPPNTNDGASFTNSPGLPGGDPYVVTLPNPVLEGSPAPPTPADGISFTNSPGLPGGDPYVVILPGSNPKATVAPQSTNNSATFANSPGLPAGDPYVVTLPKPKPQTTAAAQALPKDVSMSSSPAKAPPPDEMSFSSSVGALPGDPSVPILPKPQATSRAADSSGTKPEGTPLPNSGSLPPLGKIGVLPGLTEVSVPSPKAEGSDSISPPNPEAHLSSLSTNGGKFEPYNPIADPLGPGTELSEALEDAESNTWGPIIWEPVPAKPKNVKQLPKPVGPPVVVPAPAFPSNNIAPQPSATPTSAPEIPNSPKDPTSPGLQEPSAPDILAPNVAPQPIAGPTSLPASDSPKPQNGVPATESVSEGPYVPIGYDPAVPAAETMGAEGGSNTPPASPVAAEPAPPPIAPPISAQPESVVPEAAPATAGIASLYAQCGGRGYNGPTKCAAGSGCKIQNEWYYQCVAIDEAGYSSTLSQQQEQQQNGGRNDESEGERSRSDPQETYSDRKKSQPFTPQSARPEGRHGPAST